MLFFSKYLYFAVISVIIKKTKSVYCSIHCCYNLAMKLYHGSKQIVAKPLHKGSKIDNDYGSAFYLTKDLEAAHEFACKNDTIGVVNEYELDINGLHILDLTDSNKYSVLNWIAILLHYRSLPNNFVNAFKARLSYLEKHYFIDIDKYDLVIGLRADDAYFRFPTDFVRGNITLEQLEYSYKLGDLGIQYVITSQKGIDHLKYIRSFESEEKYVRRYFETVNKATKTFDSLNKDEEGTRIFDITRQEK